VPEDDADLRDHERAAALEGQLPALRLSIEQSDSSLVDCMEVV
jgi:hypothetical protein